MAFWRCDPQWRVDGGETFEEIQCRFDNTIKRIASKHPDQTIAIFAHGCIIRASLALWLGIPLDRIREIPHGDNTSVAHLEYTDGSIRVCSYNDTEHLSGVLSHAPHPASNTDEETAAKIENTSLYFTPFDLPARQQDYIDAVITALQIERHSVKAEVTLSEAIAQYSEHPECFFDVMLNDQSIGILQLGTAQDGDESGHLQLLYLKPEFRYRGLGIQIVGQAVSVFRAKGVRFLELRCPDSNETSMRFFEKYAFVKSDIDEATLRKYIGY